MVPVPVEKGFDMFAAGAGIGGFVVGADPLSTKKSEAPGVPPRLRWRECCSRGGGRGG